MEKFEIPFLKKINDKIGNHPIIKKILGAVLLLLGIIAMVTPFTPGAIWLIVIGLELLGFHFLLWSHIERFLLKKKQKDIK